MIKHKQLFLHKPDQFQYGDCHRTVFACLLNIPVWQAPHFIGEWELREALKKLEEIPDQFRENYCRDTLAMVYCWQDEQEAWLNELGYTTVDISYDGALDLETLFQYMNARNPEVLYILGGRSPRGTNHSVICRGGGFEHDPHPEGGFLVGPMDNGMYEVTFILPLILKAPL